MVILGAALWVLFFLVMVWAAYRLARLLAPPRAHGYRPPAGTSARVRVDPYRRMQILAWGVGFSLLCLCFATTAGRLWGEGGAASQETVRGACLTLAALLGGLFLVLAVLNQARRRRLRPAHGPQTAVPVLTAVVPALFVAAAVFAAIALVLR